MTLETPVLVEATGGDAAITFSARQLRTIADALWSAEGVCGLTDLVVTQRGAGANMSVDVSAGMVVLQGDAVAAQGKYVCRSTAVVNVPIAAAPGAGTRTDIIVAQLYDKQADGGTQYAWTPIVVTGSTTTPPSAANLAQILVGTSVTSIVNANITTPARQFATLRQNPAPPTQTIQAVDPPFNSTAGAIDFLSGSWPALTTTFPPSGIIFVTISGTLGTSTAATNVYGTWRVSAGSGTFTGGISIGSGTGLAGMGRRSRVTGTPGSSVTFTPQWQMSGGSAGTNTFTGGVLIAEPW